MSGDPRTMEDAEARRRAAVAPGSAVEPPPRPARWLRSPGVRLALMLVLFLGVTAVSAAAGAAVDGAAASLLVGSASAAAALGLYAAAVRLLERRRVTELGAGAAPSGLGRGVAAGLGLFAVTIAVIAALGGYRITGWGSVSGALAVLGTMVAVATTEELLFRGVLFRIVEEVAGTWGALVVSALVFGGLHLLNPGATLWGALAIAVEAGAMLGAAYAATRTLWLPIGLHLGWNLAEGGIAGTVVSGSGHASTSLLTGALSGPAALTGGSFGPEASVVAVLVCAVPTAVLLRLAHRRGLVLPRPRPRPQLDVAGRPQVAARQA